MKELKIQMITKEKRKTTTELKFYATAVSILGNNMKEQTWKQVNAKTKSGGYIHKVQPNRRRKI